MAEFNFCGPTYSSQSQNVDAEKCVNLYPEIIEGAGRTRIALYPTPGLANYPITMLAGAAPVGPFYSLIPFPTYTATASGALYASAENGFYQFGDLGTGLQGTFRDGVASAKMTRYAVGTTHIVLAPSSSSIANAPTSVYNIATGIVTPTDIPAGAPETITGLAYINGYFVAMTAFSNKIYYTLDPTTWNALDVFQVSGIADLNLNILSDHGELWVFGQDSTQPYSLTGDPDTPFQPNPSGYIQQGVTAADSIVQLDNTIFWIGGDNRGKGIGWRAAGYIPQRVTNHAVEYAWSQYSTISDAIGFAYQDQGHSFWQINFPTADKTWVYDVSTQQWHERSYLDPTSGLEGASLARCHSFFFGRHLVGSRNSNNIFEMKIPESNGSGGWNFVTDNGNNIKRTRRTPYVGDEQEWMFHNQMQLDIQTGLGPIPPLVGPIPGTPITSLTWTNAAAPTFPAGDWTFVSVENDDTTIVEQGTITLPVGAGINVVLTLPNPYTATGWKVYGSPDLWQTVYSWDITGPLIPPATGANLNFGATTSDPFPYYRAPQIQVSWSDDWGRNFVSPRLIDCGQSGEYRTRVLVRRLGRSRGRVYEVSTTDPVPWRFVSAYVKTMPQFSRIANALR